MYLGTLNTYMILCGIFILRRYESTKVSKFLWTIYLRVFNQIIPRILKKKQIKNDKFLKVPQKTWKILILGTKSKKKEIIAFTENTKKSLKIMWGVITFG